MKHKIYPLVNLMCVIVLLVPFLSNAIVVAQAESSTTNETSIETSEETTSETNTERNKETTTEESSDTTEKNSTF